MGAQDSIQIAFKCNETPHVICTISEIKKGDIFKNNHWVVEGKLYE
jgi:hypothetical protein